MKSRKQYLLWIKIYPCKIPIEISTGFYRSRSSSISFSTASYSHCIAIQALWYIAEGICFKFSNTNSHLAIDYCNYNLHAFHTPQKSLSSLFHVNVHSVTCPSNPPLNESIKIEEGCDVFYIYEVSHNDAFVLILFVQLFFGIVMKASWSFSFCLLQPYRLVWMFI